MTKDIANFVLFDFISWTMRPSLDDRRNNLGHYSRVRRRKRSEIKMVTARGGVRIDSFCIQLPLEEKPKMI